MFGFKKRKTVRVQFFENGAAKPFAVTEMPLKQLPETFEVDTTMHLGEEDWSVVRAEPFLIAQIAERGRLDLHLRKIIRMSPKDISYSQVDITKTFDDLLKLSPEEWVQTVPLNSMVDHPESQGLPPKTATTDEVYRIAQGMSVIREAIPIETDGVYCPVCHIANTELGRLKTPCPKCNRKLLKFGWT